MSETYGKSLRPEDVHPSHDVREEGLLISDQYVNYVEDLQSTRHTLKLLENHVME